MNIGTIYLSVVVWSRDKMICPCCGNMFLDEKRILSEFACMDCRDIEVGEQ